MRQAAAHDARSEFSKRKPRHCLQLDAAAEAASGVFERCTCVAIVPPATQQRACGAADLAVAVGRAAGVVMQLLVVTSAADAAAFLQEVRTSQRALAMVWRLSYDCHPACLAAQKGLACRALYASCLIL